jgi:TIR domain
MSFQPQRAHDNQTVPTLVTDDFRYDVFVSYRRMEPDRSWVHDRLVPRLRADDIAVCLDDDCFLLGAPLILEIERAVVTSRYTLAVLTPAYVQSGFTELENVMAEHLGLERAERRLLAAMREPTKPRLGIRMRLSLDMTDDSRFEAAVRRLSKQLGQDPDL